MTDTTQGNVILSRFTGKLYYEQPIDYFGRSTGFEWLRDQMKYNSDWNWLHEAWEKFRSNTPTRAVADTTLLTVYMAQCRDLALAISYKPILEAFTALVEAVESWNALNEKEVENG